MRISLRFKLILLSLLLLAIPFSGMRLAATVKTSLLESREEALMFSARAVASALSGREGLFDRELFHALDQSRDLYLFRLTSPMRLNGKIDDWQPHLQSAQFFGEQNVLRSVRTFNRHNFSFTHLVGKRGKYLYGIFLVNDDKHVFRQPNSLALDRSDHLQIAIEDQEGNLNRYIVTASEPGWVNGYLTASASGSILPARMEGRIKSVWKMTESGYIIEIRIPMELVGNRLAFAIADVDDETSRTTTSVIGTASINDPEKMGWLLTQSTHIESILASLNRPQSKIQIVDSSQHIRASFGSLTSTAESSPEKRPTAAPFAIFNDILSPVYRLFSEPFTTDFAEPTAQPAALNQAGVSKALAGESSIYSYTMVDGEVEVMAAATPLYEDDVIIGAVVVEQTTNSILALKNKVIEESVGLTLLVLVFGGCGLLFFAFRISSRIRTLRNQASAAVGKNGQILSVPSPSKARDEIGDLSRTLNSVLAQLQAQVRYREKMADNFEHEMRTPLAGASASLKNLADELRDQPEHIQKYINWAVGDIGRMENMLTAIRDATSLKEALEHDFQEEFNLSEALDIWLEHSWKKTFSDVAFTYRFTERDIHTYGDPDRIRQMIDKLIENSVAFHQRGSAIELLLKTQSGHIQIQILNRGPRIPENLLEEIFNSMVSVRISGDKKPHLGLGLYIVRTIAEFHKGRVFAENIYGEKPGVRFTVELPLLDHYVVKLH
ncbi:MAG: ATP-binding protein [Desulfocapsaceae bacterium]|nr:ATP-binding protein [Desulfocapsaceae bacterium]